MSEAMDGQPNRSQRPELNRAPGLSVQEMVLLRGVLDKKPQINNYSTNEKGQRVHREVNTLELNEVIKQFKEQPILVHPYMRQSLLEIMKDKTVPLSERQVRVKRYVDAYCDLTIKLDHKAFPGDDVVKSGIPDYIPDGLTDMGSNSSVDDMARNREKIRADKAEVFRQSKKLLYELFSTEYSPNVSHERIKAYFIKKVAHYVHSNMKYDYKNKGRASGILGRTVTVAEMMEQQLGVCRHQALYSQIYGDYESFIKITISFFGSKFGASCK